MSIITNRDSIINDNLSINHNFPEGTTLKIVEINASQEEKVLLEIEVVTNHYVKLKGTITDSILIS